MQIKNGIFQQTKLKNILYLNQSISFSFESSSFSNKGGGENFKLTGVVVVVALAGVF